MNPLDLDFRFREPLTYGKNLPPLRNRGSPAGRPFCPSCNKAPIELPPPAPEPPAEEQPIRPSLSDQKLEENRPYALRVTLLSSTIFYAMLVSVNFDPKAEAKFERAFGAEPLGVTAQHFAILVETILFIPFIFVFYHFGMIIIQARREGMSPHALLSVFEAERYHPGLRRSKLICLAGVLYFVAICAAWIIYTGVRGI